LRLMQGMTTMSYLKGTSRRSNVAAGQRWASREGLAFFGLCRRRSSLTYPEWVRHAPYSWTRSKIGSANLSITDPLGQDLP
jgi:hypothetical protein